MGLCPIWPLGQRTLSGTGPFSPLVGQRLCAVGAATGALGRCALEKLAAGRVYPGGAPGQVGPEGAQRTRGGGPGTGTGQGARGRAAGRIRDPVALLQGLAGGSSRRVCLETVAARLLRAGQDAGWRDASPEAPFPKVGMAAPCHRWRCAGAVLAVPPGAARALGGAPWGVWPGGAFFSGRGEGCWGGREIKAGW